MRSDCNKPLSARGIFFHASRMQHVDNKAGGAEGIRTPDPHNAIVVLYQLSYDPSLVKSQSTDTPSGTQG